MEMPITEYVCYPAGIGVDGQWYKTRFGGMFGTTKYRDEIDSTNISGIDPVIDNKDISNAYKSRKSQNLGNLLTNVPEELEGAIPISYVSNYATITDVMMVLFQDKCKSTEHPCKNGVVRYALYNISECKTTVSNGLIQITDGKNRIDIQMENGVIVKRKPSLLRINRNYPYSTDTVFVKVRESAAGEEEQEEDDEDEEDGDFSFHFLDFLNIRLKF
tara:strand:- start:270 stop:920 length:651 start_codon:yes stop_codon:yes gene_type:complete